MPEKKETSHGEESWGEILGNIPKHYSNLAFVSATPIDFQIIFIRNTINPFAVSDEYKVLGEPLVQIQMSPVHFKMFVNLLERQLEKYEESNGDIKLPPKQQPNQPDEVKPTK